MAPLAALGFALAGYGCTTCIGNSGPLDEPIATAVEDDQLVVAAVLSGNRNFEGRIHPLVRASYLASPPLVVAFALAGRVDVDLTTEPLGTAATGGRSCSRTSGRRRTRSASVVARLGRRRAVPRDVLRRCSRATSAGARCRSPRATATRGSRARRTSRTRRSSRASPPSRRRSRDIEGARVLAVLGDSVTTDHISPAGLDRRLVARRPVAPGARRRPRSSSTRTAPAAATTR